MARIAVVDDSRLARTFALGCLRKLDHEVIEVDPTSVFEVLEALRGFKPDLIIMDFLMPLCPGTSLARSCREDETLKPARILMVTAHRDDEVQARLERMGVDRFLHKPFEPQALQDVVAELLQAGK